MINLKNTKEGNFIIFSLSDHINNYSCRKNILFYSDRMSFNSYQEKKIDEEREKNEVIEKEKGKKS